MKAHGKVFVTVGTGVLLCAAIGAAAAKAVDGQNLSAIQGPPVEVVKNLTLVGATVLDPQGIHLGKIQHVLLDAQTGQATFVVLDADSLGPGHEILVVPYQALRITYNPSDRRQSIVLDRRPDQLRAAPRIQNGQWQLLENPQFLSLARNFYQIRTYYTAARPIDNPSPPSLSAMPAPCIVQPQAGSGLPQDLVDFYSE